jgi:hypothetical protein
MKLTRTGPVVAGVTIAGVVGVLIFLFNPPCLFHALTGWNCPGCGTTRALRQLLHGNFLAALQYNPLAILVLPVLGVWLVGHDRLTRKPVWLGLAVGVVVAFGIARNLPIPAFNVLNP